MPRKKTQPSDAIALLKADHRAVEKLFSEFDKAKDDARKSALAATICNELIIHTMIEEEIFYPALRGKAEADLLDEAYVEHDGAKVLIAEIQSASAGDDFYDAKVTVLSEEIKHHVKEEEKRGKGLFAQARRSGVDLDALGRRMAARKAELKAEGGQGGPGKPVTRTFTGATPAQGTPPTLEAVAAE